MGAQESIISPADLEINVLYRECKRSMSLDHQSNLHSKQILNQLLEQFKTNNRYGWSHQIITFFHRHFSIAFESYWQTEKQKFYSLLLQHCGNSHKPLHTYQSQFYLSAPKPSLENPLLKEAFQLEMTQMMNSSIANEDESYTFVFHNRQIKTQYRPQSKKIEFMSQYNEKQVINSSVIIPQTVFPDRLDEKNQDQIQEFILFYKCFSDSLQQMMKSLNMFSCPFKHFQLSLTQKLKKKKIQKKTSQPQKLAPYIRKKREYNNGLLLIQVKDFIQCYTDFVWKFLEFYQIQTTQYSKFISLETVEGIILKSVWEFTGWIGQRGFQWQQSQLPFILPHWNIKKDLILNQKVLEIGMNLRKQTNPQKYLKKIVLIYRELCKLCQNADDLLLYIQKLIYQCITKNRHQRILRMQAIINKVMSIPETSGQISYAWVSWNIVLEMVKKMVQQQNNQE